MKWPLKSALASLVCCLGLGLAGSDAAGADLTFMSAAVTDTPLFCDHDGVLDNGETGSLTITLRNTGAAPLESTTGQISSATPGVSFPGGAALHFAPSVPGGTTTATLPVRLVGASGISQIDFQITFEDPGTATPGPLSAGFSARANADDVPHATAADDVESSFPASTPVSAMGSLPWRRLADSSLSHRWYGAAASIASDQSLVSPPLMVAPAGDFSFSFRHRFQFEFQQFIDYASDAGVLEISRNGGTSWTDIGAAATPGYNAIVWSDFNPLDNRFAYGNKNQGYPNFTTVSVNLGAAYQGETVRVRWRVGTDWSVASPGWEIDDIVFNNITNLPFNAVVPDAASCVDSDADGAFDASDCAPFDADAWAPPTEALQLTAEGSANMTLSWMPPAQPGATATQFDVLRSETASQWLGLACIESGGTDLEALDLEVPGVIYYYLVRSSNVCGSSLGADSAGQERVGPVCP